MTMEPRRLVASGVPGEWQVPTKPGLHSYNLDRRQGLSGERREAHKNRGLIWMRRLLLLLGLAGVGFYTYTYVDQYVYQSYANWAFDQEIAGNTVTFWDYVRQVAGMSQTMPAEKSAGLPKTAPEIHRPAPGELLGRVTIPRLNMSAVVLEGVDDATLRRSAGHVPSTALPGESGNFSIAAHRDTLFRPLKDIRVGDEVQFETAQKNLVFHVVSTKIVKPTDVSVLAPEGDSRLMTMITCYPFYYVGSAPKRFIVMARLDSPGAAIAGPQAPAAPKPAAPVRLDGHTSSTGKAHVSRRVATANQVTQGGILPEGTNAADAATGTDAPQAPKKKPGLWSKLVHAVQRISDRFD
jgi:sortase A